MSSIVRRLEPPRPAYDDEEVVRTVWRQIPQLYSEWTVRLQNVNCTLIPDWSQLLGYAEAIWDLGVSISEHDAAEQQRDDWVERAMTAEQGPGHFNGTIGCELNIPKRNVPEETLNRVAEILECRLCHEVFLALNLACPGSCDHFLPNYYLVGCDFRAAQNSAERVGWPFITNISIERCAEWLRVQDVRSSDASGRHSGPKALFALLNMCRGEAREDESFLWSIIALESLFRVPKDKNGFRTTAECLVDLGKKQFGNPGGGIVDEARSALQKAYAHRAGLLHTIGPVYRPWPNSIGGIGQGQSYPLAFVLAGLQSRILNV